METESHSQGLIFSQIDSAIELELQNRQTEILEKLLDRRFKKFSIDVENALKKYTLASIDFQQLKREYFNRIKFYWDLDEHMYIPNNPVAEKNYTNRLSDLKNKVEKTRKEYHELKRIAKNCDTNCQCRSCRITQ